MQDVLSVPSLECGGSGLVQSLGMAKEKPMAQGQVGTVMDDA